MGSTFTDSTNYGLTVFGKKKNSGKFQKLEFAAYPATIYIVSTLYLHSIYIVLGIITSLEMT